MNPKTTARLPLILMLALAAVSLQAEIVALKDGLVVDTEQGIAYTMRPKGGIAALSLDSGTEIWRSLQADQPLAVEDGRIVAMVDQPLAGFISLRALDVVTGEAVESISLEVDAQVQAQVDDSLAHRFRIVTDSPHNPDTIAWRYQYLPPRGMPEATNEPSLRREQLGAFRVASSTGEFTTLSSPPEGIFAAGPAPETRAADPALEGRRFASQDGRHMLVVNLRNGADFRRYQWVVFDAGGSEVMRTDHFIAFAPFVVAGNRLLVTEPSHSFEDDSGNLVEFGLRLVAYALADGAERWSQPLRDTEYRGPFPW
ncbi:MAG: hypothetical protein WD397_01060 [Wenzhouxiangellaceae bacterium]